MKKKTHLHLLAEKIIKKTGFVLDKEIRQGLYYSPKNIRNLILSGLYKNKPAVLKIYDDPRLSDEPTSLNEFNKRNKSKILKAPEVYNYEIISAKKGWFIMEKLPKGSKEFIRPIKQIDRKEIARLYLEYRKNFPNKPTRLLTLSENLLAHQFHIFRINRWLQLCNDKETERNLSGEKIILNPKEFIPRFEKGIDLIYREFKKREMIWCHGHFNPAELFKVPNQNVYYLIDFGHTKIYPEGYEFAFIIWSDWIMHADYRMDYSRWKKGIDDWIKEFKPIASKLNLRGFQSLMRVSLAERCLGTILADICATEGSVEEKKKRISLIYKFLDSLY